MGNCVSCNHEIPFSYYITHHYLLAPLQSHFTHLAHEMDEIEGLIGDNMDDFYKRLLDVQTGVTTGSTTWSERHMIVYLGVIALYYGPYSKEYKTLETHMYYQSSIDVQWIHAGFVGLYNAVTSTVDYNKNISDPRNVSSIQNNVNILLLSDFATGLERSEVVLKEAKRVSMDSIHMVIHGGDTYYSGTIKEQEANLLQPLRNYFPKAIHRCLRGNHDLYSGPLGFQHVMTTVGQHATYFSIENDHMIIQGMDTSVHDRNPIVHDTMPTLVKEEAEWHVERIKKAKQAGKKVIVFSHHEPITYNDSVGKKNDKPYPVNESLYLQLKDGISDIDAYFFGHQHGFMLYQDYTYRDGPTLKKPRLIGHGGCPIIDQPLEELYTPLEYDTSEYDQTKLVEGKDWHLGTNGTVINMGFAILRCYDGLVQVDYYVIHSNSLGEFLPAEIVYSEML
jgi:hypothetical protein